MHYSDGSVLINNNLPSMWEFLKLCGVVMQNYDLVMHNDAARKAKRLNGVRLAGGEGCEYDTIGGDCVLEFNGGHYNSIAYLAID